MHRTAADSVFGVWASVTSVWCHSRVLWQSPDTTLMSCFYVSARLRVCSSCACFVSCWSMVFGSQHSCLEFQFRVRVLVMLRSWTSRSFWTNLLDERIVLVHVIHWLIFLVQWNPSLHSSAALFALRPVSSGQRLTNPRANSLRVWDAVVHAICWLFWTNMPFTDRFAFESHSEWERDLVRDELLTYMSFVNEMTELVYLVREWVEWTDTSRSWMKRTSCWTIMLANRARTEFVLFSAKKGIYTLPL